MFYKLYGTPRCVYARCYRPFWNNFVNPYHSYWVVDSTIQEANQSVANTGIVNGLTQTINQSSIKM